MTIDEYRREYPNCAVCNYPETAIHHINPKGMGGSKIRDIKNNWLSLCDFHHRSAHHLIKNYYLNAQELFDAKIRVEKKKEEEIVFGAKGGLAHLQKGSR